jgi:hypothetical protein
MTTEMENTISGLVEENGNLEVKLIGTTNLYLSLMDERKILVSIIEQLEVSLHGMETKWTSLQDKLNETEKLIAETKESCDSKIEVTLVSMLTQLTQTVFNLAMGSVKVKVMHIR